MIVYSYRYHNCYDKCSCGNDGRWNNFSVKGKHAIQCEACGNSTDYYDEHWKAMIAWNKIMRGVKN